ncbi:MAG: tetratricopeptide repeat protein [Verrucomicrobia bacterium]|nr:tetratricopeptide repeat protein [Verrucomicrobiota bacterium]
MHRTVRGSLRVRRPWWVLLTGLIAAAAWAWVKAHERNAAPDATLAGLVSQVQAHPKDFKAWNRIVDWQLRRYGTTGTLEALHEARRAARCSLEAEGDLDRNLGGLVMRTRVELAFHRCQAARADAERLIARLPNQALSFQLLGDALFQQGKLPETETAWQKAQELGEARQTSLWHTAQLDLARGHTADALARLAAAVAAAQADRASSPEGIAWYRVQWGEAAFRSGDWPAAEQQYAAALSAAPQSYAALEHRAELRGAQGKVEEAAEQYRALIARTSRPELMQALGDLYVFNQQPDQAAPWYDQALAAYLAATRAGDETLYSHHLAGFYSDARLDAEQAVAWAERDLRERPGSPPAHDALAWALCKAGRLDEALRECDAALANGTRDAHILYHAGIIHMCVNDADGGAAFLRRAAEANPCFNKFHVHR